MIIRVATINDADCIARVNVEGWRTAYKSLLSREFLAGLSEEDRSARWTEVLGNESTNQFTFVAESAGIIIGFVNGGPERTEDPEFAGEIYAIYLLDRFRRRGIGTALFREGVGCLRNLGLKSMKVWVLSDNPYRPFYESHGGVIVDEKRITIGGTELIEIAFGWRTFDAISHNS